MMKRLVLIVIIGLWSSAAHGQRIGVFADPLGTDCSLVVPYPGGPVTAYVVGMIDDAAASGVTFGAFRIAGLPAGWGASVTSLGPDVATVVGNPFAEGVAFAYSMCVNGIRELFAVTITPSSLAENVELAVLPPTTVGYEGCGFEGEICTPACPHFCGCGDFGIPCYCAGTIPTTINGGPCVVATQKLSWGKVKGTYR